MSFAAGSRSEWGEELALTEGQAREAMAEACPTTRVLGFEVVSGGHASRQWRARTDEGDLLVKFPARDPDPERTRAMIRATRLAAEAGVPVVRFRAFLPASQATGTPVVVQHRAPGEAAGRLWSSLDERRRGELAGELGSVVGLLHRERRGWFGNVLGPSGVGNVTEVVSADLDAALAQLADDAVPAGRAVLTRTFDRCLARLDPGVAPSLVHGDLWWENVLVHRGSFGHLLDFEHARFADRFSDFGKLDELVFDGWPAGRAAFLERYEDLVGVAGDAGLRTHLARGCHELAMYVYFSRWTPAFVPDYTRRLDAWMRQPIPW